MKKLFAQILFFFSAFAFAQETGTIAGALSDKEMNNEPLPFANVTVKNTSKGTTSDFDGLYKIENIPTGTYTIVFSFIGYETVEIPNVKVEADKVTEINTGLGASAAALDEVMITTVSRRDSEVALLLDQKDAVDIKESIGSQELTKLGVSDAATATTKISGVSSSEASGDVYVRGLGDRYLYTTLNGLPVPSDNIDKKNIDLGLFPTRVVQSVSVSKNFSAENSADQSSGSVNINSKSLVGLSELGFGAQVGVNTNAIGEENFKQSANSNDISLGFYNQKTASEDAIVNQNWNTESRKLPMNYKYTVTAGKKFGEKFKVLFTGSQSSNFEYNEGIFQQFNRNIDDSKFNDATYYRNTVNTTGLIDLKYAFNKKNEVRALSMFVNKMTDEVYESGRNREGFVFEEVNNEDQYGQYVKDQNTKQTKLWVNQILGDHEIGERNHLTWGLGYNQVDADEPNRLRNEVNIKKATDTDPELIELANQGGFQQRRSSQIIDDLEYNARLKNEFKVFENDTVSSLKISAGGNFRYKTRDFESDKFGVDEAGAPGQITPPSIDDLNAIFTLLDGAANDKKIRDKYLERASKGVDRLIYIVRDLDMITKLETGDLHLYKEKFNIIELVEGLFDMLEMKASKKNISLTFDMDYEQEIMVFADKERIQQVVTNLIVNSIKYGKNGGTTEVSIENLIKNKIIVRITDNGEGIEQKNIPRLFERFYRVDKSGSRKEGGSGLGLSIVKHILEAHKEKIYVESDFGVGSEFSFTLEKVKKTA